jgi:hypothetical protein
LDLLYDAKVNRTKSVLYVLTWRRDVIHTDFGNIIAPILTRLIDRLPSTDVRIDGTALLAALAVEKVAASFHGFVSIWIFVPIALPQRV